MSTNDVYLSLDLQVKIVVVLFYEGFSSLVLFVLHASIAGTEIGEVWHLVSTSLLQLPSQMESRIALL